MIRPNASSISLGSAASTRTSPACISGNMARIRAHSSDALPAPVAPAISRCVPCRRTSQARPSSRLPTGSAVRSGWAGMGRAGTIGGQGVAADELQHHPPGPGRADPAQHGAEPVRQVLRAPGQISRGLAGHQPDRHPVGVPGGGDLAEHRQDNPALMPGRHPGDGHHPGPPAPVAPPAPPLAPRRASDPPGERGRPEEPPGGQDHHGPGEQERPGPASRRSARPDQHGHDGGGHRVPGDQPDQPDQQPDQLDQGDDPGRGPVDRVPARRAGRTGRGWTAGPPARR